MRREAKFGHLLILHLLVLGGCGRVVLQDEVSASGEPISVEAFFGVTYAVCRTETSYTISDKTFHYSNIDTLTVHAPWGDWVGVSDLVFQIELGPWPAFLGVEVNGSGWSTNVTEATSAYTRTYTGSGSFTESNISGTFRVEAIPGTTGQESVFDVTFSAHK